jgi:hypothetical protein
MTGLAGVSINIREMRVLWLKHRRALGNFGGIRPIRRAPGQRGYNQKNG